MENTADIIYEIANTKVQGYQWIIGSLSNDEGDGNENGKKAKGLDWQNNNFARASCLFVHFFAVAARLQRESASIHVLSGTGTQDDFLFLFLNFRIQLQKPFASIWWSKRDGISAIKFEAAPANSLFKWWRFRSRRCCLKLSNIRLYQLNPKRTWREVEDVILQDT